MFWQRLLDASSVCRGGAMGHGRPAARAARMLIGAAALLGSACGGDDGATTVGPGRGSAGESSAETPDPTPSALAITATRVAAAPGETLTLTVEATPPAPYRLRLALVGPSGNASLDRSELQTSADGEAVFRLTTPTTTDALEGNRVVVRATGGAATAEQSIYVSNPGTAFAMVVPRYAGRRDVVRWTASARSGVRCADLPAIPLEDGEFVASATAADDGRPLLANLPSGESLAVLLRGDRLAAGCADVAALQPNELREVTLRVTDVPADLGNLDLTVNLELGDAQRAKGDLATVEAALLNAFLGQEADDASRVLDAMAAAIADPGDRAAFRSLRSEKDFDGTLAEALQTPNALAVRVASWVNTATEAFVDEGLRGRVRRFTEATTNDGSESGTAPGYLFEPLAAGGSPVAADAMASGTATVTTEADDQLLLTATPGWDPARFFADGAAAAARRDVENASSGPDALARLTGCDDIAATLAARDELHAGCDGTCAATLCRDAAADLWSRLTEASVPGPDDVSGPRTFRITTTGRLRVDTDARPLGFSGTWLANPGLVDAVGAPATGFTGTATAATTPSTPM